MQIRKGLQTFLSVIGVIAVVFTAVFLILRYLDNKTHEEKWKDYYECGIV